MGEHHGIWHYWGEYRSKLEWRSGTRKVVKDMSNRKRRQRDRLLSKQIDDSV